ncbi:hypothetical protein L596_023693 [Steinernema carpocapsae]|uniref:Uncharacterized protein n=1 Tax=Steinernema carpocapsae TaxID=34508 RepID=A0A4U5MEF4_STECR|nr:hypothetical protein L596_023693 [Steinernema carpocapsae]
MDNIYNKRNSYLYTIISSWALHHAIISLAASAILAWCRSVSSKISSFNFSFGRSSSSISMVNGSSHTG